MTTKRDLVIAVLTFLLTATLFTIAQARYPTKYVNVTNWPTTPLHDYTDAEEYTVLDVSRVINGTECGMYAISCGGPFTFSPKQDFIAATNFIYMIQAYKEGVGFRSYGFTVDVNGVTVNSNHLEIQDYCPTASGANVSLAANYINPGLNNVHFQFQEYVSILKISVYVQYEYQV